MNDQILHAIKTTVEKAVDEKINGKLALIKTQLNEQDEALEEVKDLLKERRFIIQLWTFLKVVGSAVMAIGGAILMYEKLK